MIDRRYKYYLGPVNTGFIPKQPGLVSNYFIHDPQLWKINNTVLLKYDANTNKQLIKTII